ncbi:hypothetical protein [Serratia sp. CY76391]|uniref:hypothetical protein n=1 Tax=Serratia sp. CY76391 TaxID=3383681 RepID=UPI003F9F0D04
MITTRFDHNDRREQSRGRKCERSQGVRPRVNENAATRRRFCRENLAALAGFAHQAATYCEHNCSNDGRDTQFNGNDSRVEIIHPYFTITANFYVVGNETVENSVWLVAQQQKGEQSEQNNPEAFFIVIPGIYGNQYGFPG